MHEVAGGVVANLIGLAIPKVELIEQALIDGVDGNVVCVHLVLEEFLDTVLADFISDQSLFAVASCLYELGIFSDELIEKIHRGLDGLLLRGAEFVLKFECRDNFSSGLHVVIVPEDR